MRIALIPDVRYFLFTVQLFLKKLPTVVIRSVVRKDQTCTSSQRDLEKIHCVCCLTGKSNLFLQRTRRINIRGNCGGVFSSAEFDFAGKFILTQHYGFAYT